MVQTVMTPPTLGSRLELLRLFGDATRVRLAALLERDELTVAEITRVTDLPQSRVSTHLGKLREAGVLRDRRDGTSTYYSMNNGAMPPEVRRMWEVVGSDLDEPLLRGDRERCAQLLRAREGEGWPDAVAGQMERHYSPGRTWEAMARGLLGLVQLGDVLDAGSGDGALAALLAPRARSITCLDRSDKVLAAARHRLGHLPNVAFAPGDVQDLPFASGRFDEVLLFHVLVYVERPAQALAEAARVLKPGGLAVVTAVAPHQHPDVTASYGHLHAGLPPKKLAGWLATAGLSVTRCEITSREKRAPHFEVVTAFAYKSSGKAAPGADDAEATAAGAKQRKRTVP
jgi:SAM-dependent methyltransferase